MGIEAKTNQYWIAVGAVNIALNALGNPNRIQGSVASGAVISCYIEGVEGLGLDNGRNPKRWSLSLSPTYFHTNTPKYVYVAIPRSSTIGLQAVVVFPSEKLDIYGKNAADSQVGSADYYYIWLQGIISATDGTTERTWTAEMDLGSLGTYEDIIDMSESEWYSYSKVSEIVTFLKPIFMKAGSYFQNLILGNKELAGVATGATIGSEYVDSETLVVTPSYALSKVNEDIAHEQIGFAKGFWVKVKGLFGIDENGDTVLNNATIQGDGTVNGILNVFKNIFTKSIQSFNFTGGSTMTGTGWQLTDDNGEGNSSLIVDYLTVRMRAIFAELEIRKMIHTAGDYIFSPAGSVIERVDYLDSNGDMLGYETIKVPFTLRLRGLLSGGKLLARKKRVRLMDFSWSDVKIFRCWLTADDGTTRTTNGWQTGMLARCQTFDISTTKREGDGTQGNVFYWRLVKNVGQQQDLEIPDGKKHNYVDLSNLANEYASGSMIPNAGDSIVCYGAVKKALSHFITVETNGTNNPDAPAIKEFRGVGLRNKSRDNVAGEYPLFNTTGCRRTMISPSTGNEFFAPRFVIETSSGGEDELYNEHIHDANVLGLEDEVTESERNFADEGDVILLDYSDLTDDAIDICTTGSTPESYAEWSSYLVKPGDSYVSSKDGHLYVATSTGWLDKGMFVTEPRATFKQEIVGDAETSYATKVGMNYTQTGEFVRSSSENLSRLNNAEANGKNMLKGVLTAGSWMGYNNVAATVDGDGNINAATPLRTPNFHITSGNKYTFSFYAEEQYALTLVNVSSGTVTTLTASTTGEAAGDRDRYKATFTAAATGNFYISIAKLSGTVSIYHPQLEIGETATAFEANSSEQESIMRQTASGVEVRVTEKIPSQNLIPLLNWTDSSNNVLTPGVKLEKVGEANSMFSPQIYLEAGTYTFSAFMNSLQARVETRDTATGTATTMPTSSPYYYTLQSGTETYQSLTRRYFVFELTDPKYVRINLYKPAQGTEPVYRPQLEAGNAMRAYVPIGDNVGSTGYAEIKANEVNTGVRDDLGTVGVNINGSTKTIKLLANKVNFYDSAGTNLNPKIWLDPTKGTLHAVDGEFEGTVKATNLYRMLSMTSGEYRNETDGRGNTIFFNENGTVDKWLGFFKNLTVDGVTFQAGKYYRASEIDSDVLEDLIGLYIEEYWNYCTGPADEVMVVNGSSALYSSYPYVILPRCQDFSGKTVTIHHTFNDISVQAYIVQIDYRAAAADKLDISPFAPGMSFWNDIVSYTNSVSEIMLPKGNTIVLYSNGTKWIRLAEQ